LKQPRPGYQADYDMSYKAPIKQSALGQPIEIIAGKYHLTYNLYPFKFQKHKLINFCLMI
jgi:hypothetical protein